MTKVDIFSGFLGAGKTTLIKKLIKEAYAGQKIVIIENEFGQIGIDGGFLNEAGIQVTEMNSGCICCSLVGDFGKALIKVVEEYSPDRIIIEPSGVGKLSDVIKAVEDADIEALELNSFCAVIDASKCKMYMKNFAEFYRNQIEHASAIILSRTNGIKDEKLRECIAIIREANPDAPIVSTPWDQLDGKLILEASEKKTDLKERLAEMMKEEHHCHHHHDHGHHHDHECDDPDCHCHDHGHHHDHECDDPDCHCHDHGHHHHDHECDDPDCHCHNHGHHHHDHECDDPDCHCHDHNHHHHDHECDDPNCHCHDHGHHHHDHGHHSHHADDVFTSWGIETADKFTVSGIEDRLDELMTGRYGMVLRAKGIVCGQDGGWIHFDYVPGEKNVRIGTPDVTGKLCVIGTGLDEKGLNELFK